MFMKMWQLMPKRKRISIFCDKLRAKFLDMECRANTNLWLFLVTQHIMKLHRGVKMHLQAFLITETSADKRWAILLKMFNRFHNLVLAFIKVTYIDPRGSSWDYIHVEYLKAKCCCLFVCLFSWRYNPLLLYESWNFNSGNYLCTTDTK